MTTVISATIDELAVVELARPLEGFRTGSIGTVVSARPEHDAYTVEITGARGRAGGFVSARRRDLRARRRSVKH